MSCCNLYCLIYEGLMTQKKGSIWVLLERALSFYVWVDFR